LLQVRASTSISIAAIAAPLSQNRATAKTPLRIDSSSSQENLTKTTVHLGSEGAGEDITTLFAMMAFRTFNPARSLKQARHAPILRRNILIINIFLFSSRTKNEIAIALPSS
jgi:hypothetical protein